MRKSTRIKRSVHRLHPYHNDDPYVHGSGVIDVDEYGNIVTLKEYERIPSPCSLSEGDADKGPAARAALATYKDWKKTKEINRYGYGSEVSDIAYHPGDDSLSDAAAESDCDYSSEDDKSLSEDDDDSDTDPEEDIEMDNMIQGLDNVIYDMDHLQESPDCSDACGADDDYETDYDP